jgi:hypothetical protein
MSYKENIENIGEILYKPNSYNIEDIIERVFPNNAFDKKIEESKDGYRKFLIIDKHKNSCVDFIIKEDSIYVDWLTNCSSGSGTTLLHKVEQIAVEMGILKIALMDASQITTPCNKGVSLQLLSILTTGKSWYNKLGYVCEQQSEIDSYNNSIIHMLFSDFIGIIYEFFEKNYEDKIESFQTLINQLLSIIDFESTVQEVFIKIKGMLKKGQPCLAIEPKLLLLITYIKMSNIILIPPPFKTTFTKIIQPGGKKIKRKGKTNKRKGKTNKRKGKTNKRKGKKDTQKKPI